MAISSMEFLQKMQSGQVRATSKHNLQNEDLQNRNKTTKFERLKKEQNMKVKSLIPTALAFPFDPLTGVSSSDGYNEHNKFRPEVSMTTFIGSLKSYCNTNSEMKDFYLTKSGKSEWDTTGEEVTLEDRKIFDAYRVAKIFTVPTITVNGLPDKSGKMRPYGTKFKVQVAYDNYGNVVGDKPLLMQLNDFCRDIVYAQIDHLTKVNDALDQEDPKWKNKETMDTTIDKLKNSITVQSEKRDNFVIAPFFNLTLKNELNPNTVILADKTLDNLKKDIKYLGATESFRVKIDEFISGGLGKFDKFIDFIEVDIKCGAEADAMTRGKNTKYESPTYLISEIENNSKSNPDGYKVVLESMTEFLNDTDSIEDSLLKSAYLYDLQEENIPKIYKAIRAKYSLTEPWITQEILLRNALLIPEIYGKDGEDLLDEISAGLSDVKEGAKITPETDKKRKVDLKNLAQKQADSEGDAPESEPDNTEEDDEVPID